MSSFQSCTQRKVHWWFQDNRKSDWLCHIDCISYWYCLQPKAVFKMHICIAFLKHENGKWKKVYSNLPTICFKKVSWKQFVFVCLFVFLEQKHNVIHILELLQTAQNCRIMISFHAKLDNFILKIFSSLINKQHNAVIHHTVYYVICYCWFFGFVLFLT